MKRSAFSQLIKWKENPERKPLIIRGARQVGKTWLMKEFGQSYYDSFVYFNFDEEDELKSIFETNKNPQRIIELLSMIAGEKILPGETLVIFDEVQECPEALNTLKCLEEKFHKKLAKLMNIDSFYFQIIGISPVVRGKYVINVRTIKNEEYIIVAKANGDIISIKEK